MHARMTTPPQLQAYDEICYTHTHQLGGGGSKGQFSHHTLLLPFFFCCFELPIFRAHGIGDPSSYWERPPPTGGGGCQRGPIFKPTLFFAIFFVLLVFEMLVFTSFFGICLSKKHLHVSCWNRNLATGRRQETSGSRWANVGHVGRWTSGKRRANVGHAGQSFGGGNLKKRTKETPARVGNPRPGTEGARARRAREPSVPGGGVPNARAEEGTRPVMPKIL